MGGDWNENEVGAVQKVRRDYVAIQVESLDDGLRLLFSNSTVVLNGG